MTVRARVGMAAGDVKDALRRRHPALIAGFEGAGQWVCIEEWHNIDLLAFNAWAGNGGPRYGRVGYEVKVSRSDYRRELMNPQKRAGAVAFCHEFYFAVPKGLLKPEEVAFKPPEVLADYGAYVRQPCPGYYGTRCHPSYRGRRYRKGPHMVTFGQAGDPYRWSKRAYEVLCPTCAGKGYLLPSVAERICPTLWVPADVGLVEVDGTGCHIARKAPRRAPRGLGGALEPFTDHVVAGLVRHASYRPDPRHVDRLRATG